MANLSQSKRYRRSRHYVPGDAPALPDMDDDLLRVIEAVWRELGQIRISFEMAHDHDALTNEPPKPRDFQMRFFDGPPAFDPGKGRGPYYWDEQSTPNAQWIAMFGIPTDPGSTPSVTIFDHGDLGGLGDDDHTQYHTDARGDARYYTQTQLDSGQLDGRYYTEAEVNTLLANKLDLYMTLTAGESLSAGDLCYVNSSGKMVKADATVNTTSRAFLAICTENLALDASGIFQTRGIYTTSGLSAGDVLHVSTTAGDWTATPAQGSGNIIRVIGYAISSTQLYFDPDKTWIEV